MKRPVLLALVSRGGPARRSRRRIRRPRTDVEHGLESPRGAAHRRGSRGGQHRRLRLPQPRPSDDGHADGAVRPAAGAGRRTELLPVQRQRAVRDQDRQRRRREGRHHATSSASGTSRAIRTRSSTTRGRSTRSRTPTGTGPSSTASPGSTTGPRTVRPGVTGIGCDAGQGSPTTLANRSLHDAREHRPALDAELRDADGHGHLRPAGWRQGLRRPERRSVLRRPRLGLRPGGPAPVQQPRTSSRCRTRRASTA